MIRRRPRRTLSGRTLRPSRPTRTETGVAPAAIASPSAVERLESRTLLAADVVISEFMAENDSTLADRDGAFSDWIELHNRGDAAQNLDGWFLTDSSAELTQWRLPAVTLFPGEYLTVFASNKDVTTGTELHTNFALAQGGEYLALVRPDGVTVQHGYIPSYPNQSADVSYGLSEEGNAASTAVQPFTQPSPGQPNIPNAPAPVFSIDSRTFTGSISLALSLPPGAPGGAEIRYTTNRSLPTATSPLYTGPITISNSTIVRALVTAPGRTPSPVVSRNYVSLDTSVQSFNSNLPVVIMDTFGGGFNDTTLTPVSAYFIDTAASDGRAEMLDAPDFAGRGGMRLRGQSSQGFPQQPYAFETWDENNGDKSVSILGMPAESDWILYAPYSEKSLMQNSLAYEWANRMGQYAVRTRYVELFVNTSSGSRIDYAGDYRGVYIFMEKIKVDDDRVDIAKLDPNDNAAPDVTGGYIWKHDKDDAGERLFDAGGYSWNFHEPSQDEITWEQEAYLTGYIDEFTSVINGPNFTDPVNGYARYIDVDSWIDHHIMVELTKNIDGFRISTYYHKDRDGKIKMGPVWDYNLSLGNADYNNGGSPSGWYYDLLSDNDYRYFRRLFQDPNFRQRYQDRWQELRRDVLSTPRLMADIDELTSLLSDGNGNYPVGNSPTQESNNPVVRHYKKWAHLANDTWPNYYVNPSWINHVNWMRDWLQQRLAWWDSQYLAAPTITPAGGQVTAPQTVTITSSGGQTFVDTPLLQYGAPAKAFVPTADIGTTWRNRTGFSENGWTSGTTGVGYDNNGPSNGDLTPFIGLNVPMAGVNNSVYIRVPFNVNNPASIQQLILKMRYDDGFVAYVNGTRVAASPNAPATLAFDSSTNGNTHESTNFEEFDISAFKSSLVSGTNVLAIQGLNANATSSDLLIIPEIVNRSTTTQPAPVYYTTDGSDPRTPTGAVSATARLYTGPFTVSSTTRVRARSFLNSRWSGDADELYDFGENRVRVSEIMYNPAPAPAGTTYLPGDFEFIELVNTGTSSTNLNGYSFDRGITYNFGNYNLSAGGRVLLVRNLEAFRSRYGTTPPVAGTYTGALSDGGETVRLRGRVGEVIQEFTYSDGWYPQTDGQGWSLTAADTGQPLPAYGTKEGWRASEPVNGTPGGTDSGVRANSVVINEIMTNAAGSPASGDWIELRNTTGSAVNIGNWWLSDSRDNLRKWRIPAGTSVPANGYLVFTQSQFGGAFELNSSGEGVFLSSGDAAGNLGGYRVDETFAASDPGVTFGRHVKSTGGADFTALVSPTQGAANAAPVVGPVVINEIMYSPAGGKAEYIELRNLTGSTVLLHDPANSSVTWKFTGGIDYALPAGASLPAFGYAILSAIDPATFRTQYSVPAGVSVWGPYTLANGTNVLSNGGESIRLSKPGAPDGTSVRPYVQIDRVAYDDEAPWPSETNGTGRPLARRTGTAYGNDPANWEAEAVNGSPGRSNFSNDTTAPTADVVDVTPDPRTTVVDSVTITFSEPVLGLDLADLRLTLNGGANLLTASQTLTTTDNVTWTVGNLGGLTGTAGTYLFTLVAAGSGVTDTSGNALASNASDTWQKNSADTTAPTVDITDVTPDPRNTAVGTVTIVFSEPVVGFDLTDLRLTRDGGANLLTASQTLATSDGGRTWTLGNLAGLTGTGGGYALTLTASGSGIADAAGNPLAAGATDAWVTDTTAPTTDVVDVTPDPRNTAVNTVTIVFSEPVTGFGIGQLQLRRDGGPNLLTASQTLTSTDNVTWTLGNLAGLTGTDGGYVLAVGSGVVADAAGNVAGSASDAWVKDGGSPTADVVDVSPDPRRTPVGSIGVAFSEPVIGVDLGDFRLTRNGAPVDLSGAGLVPASGSNPWNITNLLSLTAAPGTYVLTFVAAGSGVTDAAGNAVAGDASDTWVVDTAAPTVDVVDVTPDPRTSAIDMASIQFSEEVTGFDVADVRLTRDGGPNLITGAQTLTKLAGAPGSWVVGNLAVLTAEPGDYVLTVAASGSGIVDAAGNALAADGSDAWRTNAPDGDAPSVQILAVSPDPRNTAVPQITILFSEPVVGFDLADLVLTRDGRGGFLGGTATLNTTDGGRTWIVGGLTTLTDDAGDYSLILDALGSGIQDGAGNALPVGATEQWTTDLTAPTVDVVDVTPDPRATPVESVQIVFSEPVTGFDLSDLTLLARNGTGQNLLTAAQTLTTSDGGRTWTLGNLAGLTSPVHGGNLVAVNASGSGIRDAAGNALVAGAFDDWVSTAVFGRHVFYNGSSLDGGSDLVNASDDAAIAADKQALLPGQVGSFANITSYRDGINGIMVDIAGLPSAGQQAGLQPGDFIFKTGTGGDPASWPDAPTPTIQLRPRAGVGGSDRVTFVWPDGAIKNTWLQVTVRPTTRTGLVAADTFYFGNLVGEVGNSRTNATVNAIDMTLTRRNLFSTDPAAVAKYDFDRDGRIGVRDLALVRSNLHQSIPLLNAPAAPPAPAAVFSDAPVSPLSVSRVWEEPVAGVI